MHKYGNARHQWLTQNYSPLWFILQKHFSEFLLQYDDSYVREFGYLRSIIPEVVQGYLKCGDLSEGFARVRCLDCHQEFLLAFSCRGRWFCPSCHAKKVVQFGLHLKENICTRFRTGNMFSASRKFCEPISSMTANYWANSVNASTKACCSSFVRRLVWKKVISAKRWACFGWYLRRRRLRRQSRSSANRKGMAEQGWHLSGTNLRRCRIGWTKDWTRRPLQDPCGDTVNVKEASYTNTIGDPLLFAYWSDPDFDSALNASYYVRMIEIPIPRWPMMPINSALKCLTNSWWSIRSEATRLRSITLLDLKKRTRHLDLLATAGPSVPGWSQPLIASMSKIKQYKLFV